LRYACNTSDHAQATNVPKTEIEQLHNHLTLQPVMNKKTSEEGFSSCLVKQKFPKTMQHNDYQGKTHRHALLSVCFMRRIQNQGDSMQNYVQRAHAAQSLIAKEAAETKYGFLSSLNFLKMIAV